jgi:hypothetical protein
MINNVLMSIQIIIHVFVQTVHQVWEKKVYFKKIQSLISIENQYIAAFYSNSYIKRPPLQPIEHTGKFTIQIWFLSESSSGRNFDVLITSICLFYLGLLIYSDHVNSKKGHLTIFIQRRMVICNIIMGSKTISLR